MASNTAWEWKPYTKTIHRTSYPTIDPKSPANSAAGKVILVTGGGLGVGRGIAKAFVEAGAKAVAILGRRENLLAEAKSELEQAGSSKILTFKADVTDQSALNIAFETTEKEVGKIDVAVANAGYLASPALAAKADVSDWWKTWEVNVKGTLLTFQAFMAHKGTNSPTFISLNTGAAHYGAFPTLSAYGASKIGAAHLITFLQAENPDVRIMSLHPGVLGTEMNDKSGLGVSLDDMSLPSSFTVWLASPAAAWLSGRFLWSNWDVDELAKMKDEILGNNELTMEMRGYPKEVGEPVVVW